MKREQRREKRVKGKKWGEEEKERGEEKIKNEEEKGRKRRKGKEMGRRGKREGRREKKGKGRKKGNDLAENIKAKVLNLQPQAGPQLENLAYNKKRRRFF